MRTRTNRWTPAITSPSQYPHPSIYAAHEPGPSEWLSSESRCFLQSRGRHLIVFQSGRDTCHLLRASNSPVWGTEAQRQDVTSPRSDLRERLCE